MNYNIMTAPCGLDCFNCPLFLANKNEKLRAKVAEVRGIPYELATCNGCRNEGGIRRFASVTEPCLVYKCIGEKNLEFCYECPDFPCDYLQPYADRAALAPHNTKVFNLLLIKKMGLEAWAETKAKSVRDTYFKAPFQI